MPNPSTHPQGTQRADASGYEKRDASAKGIFLCVFGLFAVLILGDFIVHWMIDDFRKSPTPSDRFTGSVRAKQAAAARPEFPRLQVSPPTDLHEFREKEAEQLTTYGWINQTAGVVRIPIDRAMDQVLQRGLPARKSNGTGKAGPSSYELQQQRPNGEQPEIGGQK